MKYLLSFLTALFLVSCTPGDILNFDKQNEEEILQYIEDNNLDAHRTSSGMYYVIEVQGEGAKPGTSSDVTVKYKGYFSNGYVFDQSDEAGISINLQDVIPGWTEGLTYFNEGGKGMLLIPARLGYGDKTYMSIPGGSVLIFEVELLKVN